MANISPCRKAEFKALLSCCCSQSAERCSMIQRNLLDPPSFIHLSEKLPVANISIADQQSSKLYCHVAALSRLRDNDSAIRLEPALVSLQRRASQMSVEWY
mmetsp:Transcript_31120/g.56417  ORF Transcript_31120/g.56417 Transcript_31120/m.56417 type:complete len:101 (+) Transcript_31120:90-392(+)